MLRLTEIKLPLDHTAADLRAAVLRELKIPAQDLGAVHVAKRSFDARVRGKIALTYHLDVETPREAEILKRAGGRTGSKVGPTPDTSYRFPVRATKVPAHRPIVIGTGPCGLFAGLLL